LTVPSRRSSRTPSSAPARYRRFHAGTQPDYNFPPYASTQKRCPTQPLVLPPQTISEITGPIFGHDDVKPTDNDLTRQHKGDPIGERIIVSGRVLDENGRAVPDTLVEIWQANAAGRYPHKTDQHNAPLDPNFSGAGRTVTDAEGRYRFITIRPGARRTSISHCSGRRS
jgi:protocatechuate 3,4-dioxygenase beta subunit